MLGGGGRGDYHAFTSTSGKAGGGIGCSTWVYIVVGILLLLNDLCRWF